MTGRDGAIYWPDGIWLSPINYPNKGDKTLGDIRMNSVTWTRTSLPFKVPQAIQQPMLVVLTYQGGNNYQYSAIRLD